MKTRAKDIEKAMMTPKKWKVEEERNHRWIKKFVQDKRYNSKMRRLERWSR